MSKTQVKSNDRFSKFRMESPLGKFFTILLYVVMTIIVLIVLLPVLHIIAASFSDPQAMISGKVSFWPKDFIRNIYQHCNDTSLCISSFKKRVYRAQ